MNFFPGQLLFLKALSKKEILVPAYTRADGTYVPAHYKHVNYAPSDHVLGGKSSHSHKVALKKLSAVPGFKDLPAQEQHLHVLSSAQNIQTAASKAAQVSVFKKQLLAGEKPKPANLAAFKEFKEADPVKAATMLLEIQSAIGADQLHTLLGEASPHAAKMSAPEPAGPTAEELAIAKDKLADIAAKAPGMHYPYLAWKKLTDDPKTWSTYGHPVAKLQAVVDLAKKMQADATAAAKISTFTKKLVEGKVPSPSEMAAYVALDGPAQTNVIKAVIKKSKGTASVDGINGLLDAAAKKAGLADAPEPVVHPATAKKHFGEQHEGQPVGAGGAKALFKFEGGSWHYMGVDGGWSKVTNSSWISKLNTGDHPITGAQLSVQPLPGKFGEANANKVFETGPYLVKFFDGQWHSKMNPKWHSGAVGGWSPIKNEAMVEDLNAGHTADGHQSPLKEHSREAPQPDTAQWNFDPADMGFGGEPAYTWEGDGVQHYVAFSKIDSQWQVGHLSIDTGEPTEDHHDYASAERVVAYLQSMGIHPPALADIEAMVTAGPKEGDTKAGVGGILTLKDGHWTLDNAAMVSFFTHNAIQPGTPLANAVVAALKTVADGKPWSETMDLLGTVKTLAAMQGFSMDGANGLVSQLNKQVADAYANGAEGQPAPVHVTNAAPGQVKPETAKFFYDHKLTFVDAKSDKFWQVKVDPVAKTATTIWGKNGAANPQSKTYKHPSAEAAYKAAKEAATAKQKKGYKTDSVQDGHVTVASATASYNASVAAAKGFQPKQGTVYEATLSTGKVIKFKHDGYSWDFLSDQDHWMSVSDTWKEALDKGEDVNGKKLVESDLASFGISDPAPAFAPKEGKTYTDGATNYKMEAGHWWAFTPGFGDWFVVQSKTGLFANLQNGQGTHGASLYEGAVDENGDPVATTAPDTGPKEGDVKPGASGWLVLKDGHWVKASPADVVAKHCPLPPELGGGLKSALPQLIAQAKAGNKSIAESFKKVATTKNGLPNVNLTIKPFGAFGNYGGKWAGYAKKGADGLWFAHAGVAGKNVAAALNWLEHAASVEKAVQTNKTFKGSPFKDKPAVAAAPAQAAAQAPAAAPAPAPAGGLESIDGWAKTGGQGGYNEGGTYKDSAGDEWYCKFPAGGAKVARNELLANKLYAAAGVLVPEVKLVSQGGKVGLASRIVQGAVQDKAALQAGKKEGLLSGFVADAWLANWDVVGNNPAAGKGWDNIMFADGKAVRIDPGGAMLYGGAGGKKSAFGAEVIELETMRNSAINARTAAVFGKISEADLKASAAKVLAISDAKIDALAMEFGPGSEDEKAALAKTLKARKAFIAAKFPAVAKKVATQGMKVVQPHEAKGLAKKKLDPTKLPVKVSDLPKPNDYMNWGGSGKPISDKPYVLQNIVDEKAILDFAMKGNLVALKEYKFQPVDKMTGEPNGAPKSMDQHPSQYVRAYYDSCVQFLEVVANPMAPLELPIAQNVSTVDQLAEAFPSFAYGKNISSVPSNHRLGFWFGLGFVDNWQDIVPAKTGKPITQSVFHKAVDIWKKAPALMRAFLKDVKGSGSANQPYRDGKVTDHGGRNCREVLRACYDNAMEHEEGTTIYKKISMPKAMVDEFLKQPPGLVFQNPGSMCCSRKKLSGFGSHVMTIHYAKGAKANDNMGWGTGFNSSEGKTDSEQEITSIAGARFMVMSRKMVGSDLHLEVLMLPPDPLYVSNLKESA